MHSYYFKKLAYPKRILNNLIYVKSPSIKRLFIELAVTSIATTKTTTSNNDKKNKQDN